MIKEFIPSKTIQDFMLSDALSRSIIGPFGSGKSVGCCVEIYRRAHAQEPDERGLRRTRWAIVRNTNQQLKDTSLRTWLEWFPEGECGVYKKMDQTFELRMPGAPHPVTGKPTWVEADILFRPLDTADDAKRLLSLDLTGAWVNEFREIPVEIPRNLIGRIGRFPPEPTWCGLMMDSNPPDVNSKYYQMFENPPSEEENKKLEAELGFELPRFLIWKQPSGLSEEAENLEHLPGGRKYYTNMVAMAHQEGKDQSWVDVHVHGRYGFIMDGRAVYGDSFVLDRHVASTTLEASDGAVIGIGMDFGLTPAAVWGQLDHEGRWLILGEMVTEDMGADEFGILLLKRMRELYPGHQYIIYGDPAGEQRSQVDARSVYDVLRGQGWRIFPSEQSPRLRIDSVRAALSRDIRGNPGLMLNKTCDTLIRGFQGGYQYRRKKVRDEVYEEKPQKNAFSHPHDALQYLIAFFDASKIKGGRGKEFPSRFSEGFGTHSIQTPDYNFWEDSI